MKLFFKEPTAPRYIYINPMTNMVHLLMPVMSGIEIGLDNTCKSVYSLQQFFGLSSANNQTAAVGVLTDYQEALKFDLRYMPASEEKARKAYRLSQIDIYLKILKKVQQHKRITEPLKQAFPLYPQPLVRLMKESVSNLHGVILRPKTQDNYLRITAIEPTFSANHGQMVNGCFVPVDSLLADTLRKRYRRVSFTPKSKEKLIARVVSNRVGFPVDLEQIKEALINEIQTYLGITTVNFDVTQGKRLSPSALMNQSYLDEQLVIGLDNPATTEAYTNGLIEFCTPNLFDNIEGSPFYQVNGSEHLSILTQFFLAELNIVCREQGITEANFGQILESDIKLVESLAQAVKHALEHSAPVEEMLIEYINQHQEQFELTTVISEESLPALNESPTLKERFKGHWEQIKESPHFDEFMLLGRKSSLFFTHQGCMSIHFASFLRMGWQDHQLDAAIQDFDTVDKPENVIPHQNAHIHTDMKEIEIDLSQMDRDALQALYEDINTFADIALLKQFKQERPDFKPKINAEQFLQHVAYGEQDEAEALLQNDPELAQELLRAHDISFTDYSDRTFKCTAYEYAYWAKDTHMQRMLEKYIRMNEETRQLILHRVQGIEQLVRSAQPPRFFGFFQPPPIPQGLRYTTQDKQGLITEHQDAGFDLKPLIRALRRYAAEYKNSDWRVDYKNWAEVGRAQLNVTAHIAHEYCHPDRSFHQVKYNNRLLNAAIPGNLKRQLIFLNNDTHEHDFWFSSSPYSLDSELGVSLGISRGGALGRTAAVGRGARCRPGHSALIDADALYIIDEVRTQDRKQSLLNLSQPLNLKASESHAL